MDKLGVTLPQNYSPLQKNGNGNQGVYLTLVPKPMADVLSELIGKEAQVIINNIRSHDISEIKDISIERGIKQNTGLEHTEKEQLVKSRRGQGVFRTNVERIENACRITGVTAKEHLIASHIKPWRDALNSERLDGNNGLLLSPHIDALFDKGYITFLDNGVLELSNSIDLEVMRLWGIPLDFNVGSFNDEQKIYLAYHREYVFK
jgi:putative restriction endonuclease